MSSITAVSEKIKTFIKKELADSSLNHFSLSLSSQNKKLGFLCFQDTFQFCFRDRLFQVNYLKNISLIIVVDIKIINSIFFLLNSA
jgi:hypothetical protein